MKNQGGIEVGQPHYPYMVIVHVLFLLAVIGEMALFNRQIISIWPLLLGLFVLTQIIRVWIILTLGKYWNTKIIILPEARVVKKGPYRYLKHPNYVIVMLEFVIIPCMYQAYWTALIFSLINLIILSIRIPAEEDALASLTEYKEAFEGQKRFIPSRLKKV